MVDPVTLFKDGGPLAYLVLMVAMAGLPVSVVLAVVGIKLRVPAAVYIGVPLLALGTGIVGTQISLQIVEDVLPKASFETRATLAANGLSVSLYTVLLGVGLSGALLGISAGMMGIGGAIRSAAESEWAPLPGAVGLLGVILALISVPWTTASGIVAAMACFGVLLASLRVPRDEAEAAALVEMRGGAAILGATAVGLFGWSSHFMFHAFSWSAMAKASAETRQILLANALEANATVIPTAVGLAVLVLVVGLAAVALGARSLTVGTAGSLVVSLIVAAITVASPVLNETRASSMVEATRQFGEIRADLLEEWGISPPEIDAYRSERPGVMISIGREIRVDDVVVAKSGLRAAIAAAAAHAAETQQDEYGVEYRDNAVIEANAGTTMADLTPVFEACKASGVRTFSVAARSSRPGLRIHDSTFADERPPPLPGKDEHLNLRVAPLRQGFRLMTQHGTADAPDLEGVTLLLARLKDEYPYVETAFIHAPAEMTVDEYLGLAVAMLVDKNVKVDGRPRLLFPYVVFQSDPLPGVAMTGSE